MPQFHAAYAIPELLEIFSPSDRDIVRALFRSLATFELEADVPLRRFDGGRTSLASLIAVAGNLVSRGLPTWAPLAVSEAVLRAAWPGTVALHDNAQRGVGFTLSQAPSGFAELLVRALHVTEPRLDKAAFGAAVQEHYPLDSQAEHQFLVDIVAQRFGTGLAQALRPQVPLDLILHMTIEASSEKSRLERKDVADALHQCVDFALFLPYVVPGAPAGLILEVDGPQHQESAQRIKDRARVETAKLANWQTDRIPVNYLAAPEPYLVQLMHVAEMHPYCLTVKRNHEEPLHRHEAGLCAEQLVLSPVLAARVHLSLIEAVAVGILQWDQPAWVITIVERDVPGGRLGVEAFVEQMRQLFALEGAGRNVPAIELTVLHSAEYANCALHEHQKTFPLANYAPVTGCHLILDVSVLARPGLLAPVSCPPGATRLVIRSSGLALAARTIRTAPLIRYADVSRPDASDEYLHHPLPGPADALRFFLRDIFRKSDFRPGQLPILKRGLQATSVLGLLPTGGGKSLTYQLAGLLQPGVSLVVDPIKSLMQDQYEGLLANGIDAAEFLNSSVYKTAQHRLDRLEHGQALFFFVSPERLQIQGFRDLLARMTALDKQPVGFSFCVVDEAHCVSEWGHDFRTQYLRLGDTVRRFCRTFDRQEVPIYGLTATASFDVLADVQRELALPGQEAIVRTRTTRRRELRFCVLAVKADDKHGRIKDILSAVPYELANWSAEAEEIGREESGPSTDEDRPPRPLPLSFGVSSFYARNRQGAFVNAGLIFCPHKSPRISTGVGAVLNVVAAVPNIAAGKFTAGFADFGAPQAEAESQEMMQTQRDFVGNRLNLLVATKAFGMGIDKPNVRFTVHYCYPSSIESLVQEAGRAGRDGAVALNYILFDPADAKINASFFSRNFRGRRKEALMVNELLTKVSLPAGNQLECLRELLAQEFIGSPIAPLRGGLWPKIDPYRLYINRGFQQAYGYVDLRHAGFQGNCDGCHSSIDRALADAVLKRTSEWLREGVPADMLGSTEGITRWLGEQSVSTSIPGILPTLANAPSDQVHPTLVVGLKNGEASRISQFLSYQVSEQMVWRAAGFAADGEEFAKNLLDEHNRNHDHQIRLTEEQFTTLGARLEYLRDEQDTYKAVHRLTLLGVVADYIIDYGAKTLTLSLNRNVTGDGFYREAFIRYVGRYTTWAKAEALAQRALHREKGSTILEKILGELLDFTYGEIADKRQRATLEMALACEKGVAAPHEDLGEFFDLYFNSKYARAQYLPEDTRDGAFFDRQILWNYLGYMTEPPDGIGKERDNVKHLRGACARMLSAGANKNGAILLLDAFAIFFLEAERKVPLDRVLAIASEKLLLGFRFFQEQDLLCDDDLIAFFDEYAARAHDIEPEVGKRLRQSLRQLLMLDIHRRWLSAFNDRFDDRAGLPGALQA